MNKQIKDLIKLSTENPEMEVKFNISGDLSEDDYSNFVGEISNVYIGYYIEFEDKVYEDFEYIKEQISDELYNDDIAELSDEEYDRLVQKEVNKLPFKNVIWVYVGV